MLFHLLGFEKEFTVYFMVAIFMNFIRGFEGTYIRGDCNRGGLYPGGAYNQDFTVCFTQPGFLLLRATFQ